MALALATPAAADDAVRDPASWPTGAGTDPDLGSTAHTIRFSGPDRSQTSLAVALALASGGQHPYAAPAEDAVSWGAASCPRAVIVVAGDTFADALAAASLSDPTNRSSEPRLERVAAEDPLFDPIGGFDRVDTEAAPIIVTDSTRAGATALSGAAKLAVADLAGGHCTTARDAIVVGGDDAVPSGVESELVSLGYREVFRVAGDDRYATAAAVAVALGTGTATAQTCVDGNAGDGSADLGFYGNGAPEFRRDPSSCQVLTRAVVLADGVTGADALAAGWWTSYWQVPVLLTGPGGELPAPTQLALQSLAIDNVIVLGGTGRIPDSTVDEAGRLASAAVGRISGVDRYGTSAAMARAFGGWYGRVGSGSIACIAASSGSGHTATGWPDALAAAPLCGRLTAADAPPPTRLLPPVSESYGATTSAAERGRQAVPILLVPGPAPVPFAISELLEGVLPPSGSWCAASFEDDCIDPAFGLIFGGRARVTGETELALARLLSGGRYADHGDTAPRAAGAVYTELPMAPVFDDAAGAAGAPRVCWPRDGVRDVRWLTAHGAEPGSGMTVDLAARGTYREDADGEARAPGRSAPICLPVPEERVELDGVSLSGAWAGTTSIQYDASRRLTLGAAAEGTAVPTGAPSSLGSDEAPGETTSWTVRSEAAIGATVQGHVTTAERLGLEVSINRAESGGADTFRGTITVETGRGSLVAAIDGEAMLDGTTWQLRGRLTSEAVALPAGVGGFTATIATGEDEDALSWRFDAVFA